MLCGTHALTSARPLSPTSLMIMPFRNIQSKHKTACAEAKCDVTTEFTRSERSSIYEPPLQCASDGEQRACDDDVGSQETYPSHSAHVLRCDPRPARAHSIRCRSYASVATMCNNGIEPFSSTTCQSQPLR